ncbi:hypothetical protein AAFC00_004038 [Neodothiora populina]|uniref:Uncharacterized protein n=1 Tax=Neodothiora populina TaxID=2781224 RepID=A0ABR3PIC4_9PEZI
MQRQHHYSSPSGRLNAAPRLPMAANDYRPQDINSRGAAAAFASRKRTQQGLESAHRGRAPKRSRQLDNSNQTNGFGDPRGPQQMLLAEQDIVEISSDEYEHDDNGPFNREGNMREPGYQIQSYYQMSDSAAGVRYDRPRGAFINQKYEASLSDGHGEMLRRFIDDDSAAGSTHLGTALMAPPLIRNRAGQGPFTQTAPGSDPIRSGRQPNFPPVRPSLQPDAEIVDRPQHSTVPLPVVRDRPSSLGRSLLTKSMPTPFVEESESEQGARSPIQHIQYYEGPISGGASDLFVDNDRRSSLHSSETLPLHSMPIRNYSDKTEMRQPSDKASNHDVEVRPIGDSPYVGDPRRTMQQQNADVCPQVPAAPLNRPDGVFQVRSQAGLDLDFPRQPPEETSLPLVFSPIGPVAQIEAPTAIMTTGPTAPWGQDNVHSQSANIHRNLQEGDPYGALHDERHYIQETPSMILNRQQRNSRIARELAKSQQDRAYDARTARDDNYSVEMASYAKSEQLREKRQFAKCNSVEEQRLRIHASLGNGRSASVNPHSKRTVDCSYLSNPIEHSGLRAVPAPLTPATETQGPKPPQEQLESDCLFSPDQIAAFEITELDLKICDWKDRLSMSWKDTRELTKKMTSEDHTFAEIRARYKLTKLKMTPSTLNAAVDQTIRTDHPGLPHTLPQELTESGSIHISQLDNQATSEVAKTTSTTLMPAEIALREKIQLEYEARRLAEMVNIEKEKRRMAEELGTERERREEAESRAAEQAQAAREARLKAAAEEKARMKAEQEERKKQNEQRLAQAARHRGIEVGRATGTGFSFPQSDRDDTDSLDIRPGQGAHTSRSKTWKQRDTNNDQSDEESERAISFQKPRYKPKKLKSGSQQEIELNARGFATQSGKTCLDFRTLDAYIKQTEDEVDDSSEEEPLPEEILGEDLTYHMYLVKYKSWSGEEEPDDDEEHPGLSLTLGEFPSMTLANAAATDEILRYSAGDPGIVIDQNKPFSFHSYPGKDNLSVLQADVPNGHIKVWVVPDLRSRFRGELPNLSKSDFYRKSVYIIKETILSSLQDEASTAEDDTVNKDKDGAAAETRQGAVQEVGDIYTRMDIANKVAADRFVEATFTRNARRIDEVNAQMTSAKWDMNQVLEELRLQDQLFCMEKPLNNEQTVKIWVEERKLSGPRN